MRILPRQIYHLVGAAMAVVVASSVAQAETDPVDSFHVIVPCSVGGPADLVARAVAQMPSERFGQQVPVGHPTASSGNPGAGAGKLMATRSNAILVVPAGTSEVSPCGE